MLLPFVLTGGAITVTDGVILVGIFVDFLADILSREAESDTPVFRNSEIQEMVDGGVVRHTSKDMPFVPERDFSDLVWLGLSVLAFAGLVVGAATLATGTESIIAAYGVEGTIFGTTIATAVLTIEDIFLTVKPIRRGAPEIGIGNVIGSVIFSVTAKLGVIALMDSIAISPLALTWRLPVLIGATVLTASFIYTGRLKPWHGYTLLGLYIAYWVISYVLFGFVPAEA